MCGVFLSLRPLKCTKCGTLFEESEKDCQITGVTLSGKGCSPLDPLCSLDGTSARLPETLQVPVTSMGTRYLLMAEENPSAIPLLQVAVKRLEVAAAAGYQPFPLPSEFPWASHFFIV